MSCLRLAAFSQQAPSCCSFRQREKTATCGLCTHKPEQMPGPHPAISLWSQPQPGLPTTASVLLFSCLLWSFSASRILLHSPTGTHPHPNWFTPAFSSESVVCKLGWVSELPKEGFTFIRPPTINIVYVVYVAWAGWLEFYINI